MILVILGIGILLSVTGYFILAKINDDSWIAIVSFFIGIIIAIISIIVILILGVAVSMGKTIDNKIEMYKTENENIQSEISLIVEGYKEFEKETYEKFKNESPTILIQMFPELKSDTLVNKQIDLFIENNNKIKELQLDKINLSIRNWWLYFGN